MLHLHCQSCDRSLPLAAFYKHDVDRAKMFCHCKECKRARQREIYTAIRDGTWWPTGQKRTTPKPTVSPSPRQIEWAVGFLEGEGSFCFGRGTQVVSADQLDPDPLLRLQAYFGGAVKRKRTPKGRPLWFWSVSGSRARGVMMTFYSLLSTRRREQIRIALAYRRTHVAA